MPRRKARPPAPPMEETVVETLADDEKGLPRKRFPLNMRTTRQLRDRLQRDADASGRSLIQEVELRLEKSFLWEEMFFFLGAAPERTAQVLRQIIACFTQADVNRGKAWPNDPALARELAETISIITKALMTGDDVTPIGDAADLATELQAAVMGKYQDDSPARRTA